MTLFLVDFLMRKGYETCKLVTYLSLDKRTTMIIQNLVIINME